MDPGVDHLSQSSEEQLCRGTGPVQEDLRYQSDGHLQHTQQTDGQVEAGGTHLEQGRYIRNQQQSSWHCMKLVIPQHEPQEK